MVVRASHVTHSVPRATIDALLNRWQIQSDRLENARSGRPNPQFADPRPQDFVIEGARNAIRQYRLALTRKQRDALLQVYPALGRSSVDALFGDALRIDLDLQDCSELNAAQVVTCEFAMTIYRRTGRAQTFKSRGVNAPGGPGAFARMKFALKRDQEAISWVITEIVLPEEAQ
jgi:hypothetical protein